MSHPELIELTRAEQLFDVGKLDEALELLNDRIKFEGLNLQQKSHFQFLMGLILIYQNKSEEIIELGEHIFNEGQKLNQNLQTIDGLFFIIMGLGSAEKFNDALKIIETNEIISNLGIITSTPKIVPIQSEARISVAKAWIYMYNAKIDLAEKCLLWCLSSQKEIGNTFVIVWANLLMTQIMLGVKNRYDLAMEYTKKALALTKGIKFNHFWVATCHVHFGVIYSSIGEMDISLKYSKKSLAIFKEIGNNFYAAGLLGNIGNIYVDLGNYDIALKYLEESLLLYEIQSTGVANALDNLIMAALEKGDIERAQKYFQRLESIYNQKKEGIIVLVFQRCKALILLKSSRIRDKAKAEELLKKVIETETLHYDIIIDAIVRLCDLLLSEFRINNNSEVLDELNQNIDKLLIIAEKSHSYLVFCKTFILQAKLALINFNMKAARRFLTQAQKIAESYGIKRLAMKISYEHDELLRQSKMWENLKESEISMSERWKLAGLSEQMEKMVRKRRIEVPELSDEEPVLLLIVSEGGVPFFSKSFIEEKSFESHLFGGFLSTIDYFIREMFSEGLDRAVFGEYTLLMKPIPPFFISYIFKGNSYYALKKLDYFIAKIQSQDEIWQNLLINFQKNTAIQLKDTSLLESLITETFLNKNPLVS